MPIPQFHRTPKTRKRRTRGGLTAPENFDAQDTEFEIDAEHESPATLGDDENCALLQPGDAGDRDPAPPDEVPALLSWWPPRRSK
ncbi:MAG TPA: hypothetical protein VGN65_10005 [Casimicrobiaceae bacterium]|jgi:hypothetical protein